MKRWSRLISLAVVVALLFGATSVRGEGLLFSRKFYGYVSLGAGGMLLMEAYRARQDAGDFDDRYEKAGTSPEARMFKDERKRYRTRSATMLVLGTGALAYSMYLFRTEKEEELPVPEMGLLKVKGVKMDVAGDPVRQRMLLVFSKGF